MDNPPLAGGATLSHYLSSGNSARAMGEVYLGQNRIFFKTQVHAR